jgi:hypothetical protein
MASLEAEMRSAAVEADLSIALSAALQGAYLLDTLPADAGAPTHTAAIITKQAEGALAEYERLSRLTADSRRETDAWAHSDDAGARALDAGTESPDGGQPE